MDHSTKPCARCGTAPRNSSNPSYCEDCRRAFAREGETRRPKRQKPPLVNCARCHKKRDGRHPGYCIACWKIKREERLAGPCGRCGKTRREGDRTNSVYCYDCWRDWWLQRKYGMTGEQYEAMLADQDQRCAICRTKANGRTWHVDHDHESGQVRGILCDNCNRGLGHLKDDPALLRRAAEYLERF